MDRSEINKQILTDVFKFLTLYDEKTGSVVETGDLIGDVKSATWRNPTLAEINQNVSTFWMVITPSWNQQHYLKRKVQGGKQKNNCKRKKHD